ASTGSRSSPSRSPARCCAARRTRSRPKPRSSLPCADSACDESTHALSGLPARAERATALDVGVVDHVAVPLDVPALPADDEHDEVLVARVRDAARRRRRDVHHPAGPEQPLIAVDLDPRGPGVDEVQLVLLVVVVLEPLVAGRHHDHVGTEGVDTERAAHLPEPVALAELVDRPERVRHLAPSVPSIASIVRRSPSSKPTTGSKPIASRAAVTSAHDSRTSPGWAGPCTFSTGRSSNRPTVSASALTVSEPPVAMFRTRPAASGASAARRFARTTFST